MLKLVNINKKFNINTASEVSVFNGFNLAVNKGDFVSVVGGNGSGKTTLLNIISGCLSAESGKIFLNDVDITKSSEFKRAKVVGRVFQDPSKGTAGNMTIAENLCLAENKGKMYDLSFGLSKKKLPIYREKLCQLNLKLEDKLDTKVGLLSGGQRQALALLMATYNPIDVLLLDEHTSALDPKTSQEIMELTSNIIKMGNITTIMVTHNLRFSVEFGNRLVMLNKGEIIMDEKENKGNLTTDDVLKQFNQISLECGN